MTSVDVAVVGAGTAGMAAYQAAVKRGKKVLLIEAAAYGTTCARVGCMPSKLLIAAAEAAHRARRATGFGVTAEVKVDGRAVMERLRRERDHFVGFALDAVELIPASRRLKGRARFVSPNELDVGGTRVTARTVVLATGSSPDVPPLFDPIRDRLVVSDDVFAWGDLPESVVVFGAGVVGLELGQALHRLGVRVRVLGRGNDVGPLGDPRVKAVTMSMLEAELPIDFDARVRSVKPLGDGVEVRFVDAYGEEHTEPFAVALVAVGRRPNMSDLGLENAGLPATTTVDRTTLQWGDSHVFVAGDATDDAPVLHEAADEGTLAGENAALFPEVRPGRRRSGLSIAFTDPPLAVVGGGFTTASARGAFATGEIDFREQGKSRIMLRNHGVARVYADPVSRRFLGAELACPHAEHLAHLLAWAHQAEMTIEQMLAMPFYHPVVEEGLRTALRDAAAKLVAAPDALRDVRAAAAKCVAVEAWI